MIKVNFNKKQTENTFQSGLAPKGVSTIYTAFTKAFQNEEALSPSVIIKVVVNFTLILLFPLGLKFYEIHEIKKLTKIKDKETLVLNENKTKLSNLKQELENYAYLENEHKEFASKRDFFKKISGDRLIIPRTIDSIQDQIPKDVWLNDMNISLSGESKKVKLSGFSFKEASVNQFASSLKDILDKETIFVDTKDIKEGDINSVIKIQFDLKGELF
ncbi:MAG: PilN domain-containing protein [Bdellovibrionales bacterium]|nr:PilN domain-containing protein [Bdellovibrionales bacterium]